MHLLSVDHFLSSKLEWGIYNTLCTACYLLKKKHAVMYCMFPYSNFDDWKWSTDKRSFRNEITSYKIHTLVKLVKLQCHEQFIALEFCILCDQVLECVDRHRPKTLVQILISSRNPKKALI